MAGKWTKEETEKMNRLYNQGWTLWEIAEVLGRTYGATVKHRGISGSSQKGLRQRIPDEHRLWYEKLRRNHSRAFARAELRRVLSGGTS